MPNDEEIPGYGYTGIDPTDLALFGGLRASLPISALLYSKELNSGPDAERFARQKAYEMAMAERQRDEQIRRAIALREQQQLDAQVPPEVQRFYINSRYDPATATRRADYETPPTRRFGSPGTEMRAAPRRFQKGGKVAKTIREMADELLAGSVKMPNSATGTGKSNALSTARREIAPQVEAMLLAQRRASLPISEGGLGLPAGNTPEQRATLMGFIKDRYHGSVSDIKKLDADRTSDLGYYGKGIYSTDSPKDASNNYAKIIGPDVEDKVNRAISGWSADRINDFKRKTREATPSQLEALIYDALGADNYGVVYPLKVRSDKSISLNKRGKQPLVVDANSDAFRGALSRLGELGGDIPRIEKSIAELGDGDSVLARDMFNLIDEGVGRSALVDPQSRKIISDPQAASDFVKQLGVDEINHRPQFGSSRLDIGKEHTISLDPDNVRSRFAAFDPFRRNAAIAAAMGAEAPDLLAEEQKKEGGAVQRFQKGGKAVKTIQRMADELLAKGAAGVGMKAGR